MISKRVGNLIWCSVLFVKNLNVSSALALLTYDWDVNGMKYMKTSWVNNYISVHVVVVEVESKRCTWEY